MAAGVGGDLLHTGWVIQLASFVSAQDLASGGSLLNLAQMGGAVGVFWYLNRLATRLSDKPLRISFAILKWFWLANFVLGVFGAASDWKAFRDDSLTNLYAPVADFTWRARFAWICVSLSLSAWFAWMDLRFVRLLGLARKKVLAAKTQ